MDNERGDLNVPGPIRGREVAYSGRRGSETPGGKGGWSRGGFLEGGPSNFATGS
jgi:hypothetical protein